MVFHGTPSKNLKSIQETGLTRRHSGPCDWFGYHVETCLPYCRNESTTKSYGLLMFLILRFEGWLSMYDDGKEVVTIADADFELPVGELWVTTSKV